MLIAWIALTLGITLGSWWAYYDLGWGGFWFWDPVENASLMPWLVATALLHSALATERTGAFRLWTLLLSILAFSLSLIGTFLVRSGVLSSVHAFASDPKRGEFILLILSAAIAGALGLFAWRAPKLESGTSFEPASRETTLLVNNIFLVTALGVVFIGTLYPILLAAFDKRISVGAPYFEMFFAPIFIALMIVLPFGPRLAWRRGDLKAAFRTLLPALGAAAVAAIIVLAVASPRTLVGAGAFAVAAWVIGASAVDLTIRLRTRAITIAGLAAILAHAGLGVTLMGVAGTDLWRSEALEVLAPGETMSIGRYTLRFEGVKSVNGPNYQAAHADFDILRDGACHRASRARAAHVSGRGPGDGADRDPHQWARGSLCRARRRPRRRTLGDPRLCESAGASDLARRGGDGAGRAREPVGPRARDVLRQGRRAGGARAGGRMRRLLFALLFLSSAAFAERAPETLPNPAQEARAQALQKQFRCLVCQGESIDESGAPLAADLRRLIREHIVRGESDAQVKDYLVARYGDFILMNPPVQPDTYVLWAAPFVVLLLAAGAGTVVVLRARRRTRRRRTWMIRL